jgi:membrane protein DedA with SNARE-associated domain
MNPWLVFALTWGANVGSGAAVYALGRKYGLAVFRGVLGRRILTDSTVAHIEEQYRRHGVYGIYFSRLLPVWRGVVMPFAGIARVPPARALIPLALASATYYGALIWAITKVGDNLEDVLRMVERINSVLGGVAIGLVVLIVIVIWIVRRRRPPPPPPPLPPS